MIRYPFCALTALAVLTATAVAEAHFLFIVPDPAGFEARLIFSETLEVDDRVDAALVKPAELTARLDSGDDKPLNVTQTGEGYYVKLNRQTRLILGTLSLGVTQMRKSDPAFLLTYYPKTIVGDAYDARLTAGKAAPVEIVPLFEGGEVKFVVLAKGKPVSGAEVNLVLPDGERKQITAGAEGKTAGFEAKGRYGAWARFVEPVAGEHDGKKYTERRHYATLVIDAEPGGAAATRPAPSRFPPLPQATSSFGAAACDGYLYVYGGHVVRTHSYSTEAVSGQFHRLKLDGGTRWEALPGGPGLQGMNLAVHQGKVYRVGGMDPRNKPGDPVENFSVAEGARFDPATRKWEPLPPMPEPRSSHDLVVVGDRLMAVGGWNMKGVDGQEWLETVAVLDLSAAQPVWKSIPQPFQRRALIAAVLEGKVYVMGGFNEDDEAELRVDIYDPKASAWSRGPDLPGPSRNGFAPAACVQGRRLYVSVGDGSMLRLADSGKEWEKIARTTPRIVHRLVPFGDELIVLGGAAQHDNLDLIETVKVAAVTR